jgi:glycosyl hydrolase family 9
VIPGAFGRKPAHLNDRQAAIYAHPRYDGPDSDVIKGASLKRIGGPVDVEGGWADAGDFIKFTHATAYAGTLLLICARRRARTRSTSTTRAPSRTPTWSRRCALPALRQGWR